MTTKTETATVVTSYLVNIEEHKVIATGKPDDMFAASGEVILTDVESIVEALNMKQMVALYNEYADKSIKKFDSKKVGAERILKQFEASVDDFTKVTDTSETEQHKASVTPINNSVHIHVHGDSKAPAAKAPKQKKQTKKSAPKSPKAAAKAEVKTKTARKPRDTKLIKLIEKLQEGGHMTRKDLMDATGYTEASVIVRISTLRNPKGEFKMNIKKFKKSQTWLLCNDGEDTPYIPKGKKLDDLNMEPADYK